MTDARTFHLQGEVMAQYAELLEVFGAPLQGPDQDLGSSSCEWWVKLGDEITARIYDWHVTHGAREASTPRSAYLWHVAGPDQRSLYRVQDRLDTHRDQLVRFIMRGIN